MIRILTGDAIEQLRGLGAQSVHSVITSPPYWTQCDYDAPWQIGLEPTMQEHLDRISEVLGECRRVLRGRGTCWLNYADGYNTCNGGPGPSASRAWTRKRARQPKLATGFGLKTKDVKQKSLMGLPWRLALRLEEDGWRLRSSVIWHKPNSMDRADLDRPVRSHEYIFLLAPTSERTYFSGRTGSVWEITPEPVTGHPTPFQLELARRCIEHGCPPGGTVLDPFGGSGTVGLAADQLGRDAILIELNPKYAELAERRIREDSPMFAKIAKEAT